MAFDLCYLPEAPGLLRALARKDGSIEKFITEFEAGPKWNGGDIHTLMSLAMAATYDPDPDPQAFCGIRLPVTEDTCEIIPERWANWLRWDPVVMAADHATLLLADIQTEDAQEMAWFHEQTVPDIQATLRALPGVEAFGIADGDIMFDNLELYPDFEAGLSKLGIPFFQVVGNPARGVS